jgi:hypothetical protein
MKVQVDPTGFREVHMTADTRVSDLTVEDLRGLVRQAVREALSEVVSATDPDADLVLRPDVADYLRDFLSHPPAGTPLGDVSRDLGLDE